MRARDGGVETVGGDGRETNDEEEGKKSTTGIGASLTPDFRDKEESKKIVDVVLAAVDCSKRLLRIIYYNVISSNGYERACLNFHWDTIINY